MRVVLNSHTCLLTRTEEKQPVIDRQPEIKRNENRLKSALHRSLGKGGGVAVPISCDPNDLKLGR